METQRYYTEHELDTTQTTASASHELLPAPVGVEEIVLLGYEIRDVPMAGVGVPTYQHYYITVSGQGIAMKQRIRTPSSCKSGHGYPVPLVGELSRRNYQCPWPVIAESGNLPVTHLKVTLEDPDGAPAVFSSATFYWRLVIKREEKSLASSIVTHPRRQAIYAASVKPWIL